MVMRRRERAVARGAGHSGFDDGEDVLAVFPGGVDITADVETVLGGVLAGEAAGYLLLGFQL